MNKKLLQISLVFTLAFFLSACKSPSEKLIEKANEGIIENALEDSMGGDVKVDLSDEGVSVKTDKGTMQTGGKVSLPDNFPSDVHVYDGKLIAAMFNEVNNGFTLTIEIKDSLENVKSVYENKLKASGWTVGEAMNLGASLFLTAEKDKRAVTVVVNQVDGTSVLALTINDK